MKIVVLDGYCLNPGDLSWDGVRAFGETLVICSAPCATQNQDGATPDGGALPTTCTVPVVTVST